MPVSPIKVRGIADKPNRSAPDMRAADLHTAMAPGRYGCMEQ